MILKKTKNKDLKTLKTFENHKAKLSHQEIKQHKGGCCGGPYEPPPPPPKKD